METKQVNRLASLLGIGGLTGSVPLAAIAGLLRPENAFLIAVAFMAGPGAIATAVMLDGPMRTRMLAALLAGIIATVMVVLAAGIGPRLLGFVNLNMLKIFGGIAVGVIGLIIAGIKIPENTPLWIMLLGIIGGILWR